MFISERRLRQVIKSVLTEATTSLPGWLKSDRAAQKEIQNAIIAKQGIEGDTEAINMALGVRSGKPDGKIGPSTLASFQASVGSSDPKVFMQYNSKEEALAAIDAGPTASNRMADERATAAAQRAKAQEEADNLAQGTLDRQIEAVRSMWEEHQVFKKNKRRNAIEFMKTVLEDGIKSMEYANSDEAEMLSSAKKVVAFSEKAMPRFTVNKAKDIAIGEWLTKNDPECSGWRFKKDPAPWKTSLKFYPQQSPSVMWFKVLRIFAGSASSYPFNQGRYDIQAMVDWYDNALSGSELSSMDSMIRSTSSVPSPSRDQMNSARDSVELRALKASGSEGPPNV